MSLRMELEGVRFHHTAQNRPLFQIYRPLFKMYRLFISKISLLVSLTTGNWTCRQGRETLDKQGWLYMPSKMTGLPCSLSDCSTWPPPAHPVSWVCFLHHFLLFWKDSLPGLPHLLCGFDSRLAMCWCFQTVSSHLFFPSQLFTNFMNRSYIFIVKTKTV